MLLDVIFLLDVASLTTEEMSNVTQFLVDVVDRFNIDDDAVQVRELGVNLKAKWDECYCEKSSISFCFEVKWHQNVAVCPNSCLFFPCTKLHNL